MLLNIVKRRRLIVEALRKGSGSCWLLMPRMPMERYYCWRYKMMTYLEGERQRGWSRVKGSSVSCQSCGDL